MATISQLQKQAQSAPKFVLFSDQFGFDMYFADPAKYAGIITDTVNEAQLFSVGFDNEEIKCKAWSLTTGYNFIVKYL